MDKLFIPLYKVLFKFLSPSEFGGNSPRLFQNPGKSAKVLVMEWGVLFPWWGLRLAITHRYIHPLS